MSWSGGWWGPALDEDAHDLRSMLDSFVAAHDAALEDDPVQVSKLVAELAELGVWTLGTADAAGGGGAEPAMTLLTFERLGRAWPALGWASVQAHAAVDAIASENSLDQLVSEIHTGSVKFAVVDADSAHVRLGWSDGMLLGSVDRVDAAGDNPHLLILVGDDTALVVGPSAIEGTPLRRTGLSGALTRSLVVEASAADIHELAGVDVAAVRTRLWLGAASVAAGIAGSAADAAADYAAARRQFGDTLTAISTVRQSLLGQATRSIGTLAAVLGSATDPVRAYAVALESCDGAIDVAAAALQSHGGYGYLAEYAAERRLRDAVSLRAAVDTRSPAAAIACRLAGAVPERHALRKEAP